MKSNIMKWLAKNVGPFLAEVVKDSVQKSLEMYVQEQVRKAVDKKD